MKLVDIDNDKAEPVSMSWDAAQAALAAGTHVLAEPEGDRGPDQPAAQSPKPGTEPFEASIVDNSDGTLPNMTRAVISATPAGPAVPVVAAAPMPAPAPVPARTAPPKGA